MFQSWKQKVCQDNSTTKHKITGDLFMNLKEFNNSLTFHHPCNIE
uniref:Uncharacterized protein n=1 Tax=Rhizophora mucronata TaxID=61149 RepID=A0A2P2QX90_RHIMU